MASTSRVTITGTVGGITAARLMHGRAGRRSGLALGAVLAASAMTFALGAPATGAATATGAPTLLTVQGSALSPDAAAAWVTSQGGQVLAVYDVADALLVTLPAGVTPPAGAVSVADVPMHLTAAPTATAASDVKGATYRATIGAPASATGAGVTVAVVDTGVADVADLAGRLTHVNVSGGAAGDGLGHGTFMAGLVAGDGSSSGGTYTGVAPGARILDIQVATADGSTSLSRVLAGLQAVADAAKGDPSVRVVSLALSTGDPLPPSADPLSRALDRLWAKGLTVVVSAGNDGPAANTVTSPGADPTLITVGALDEHGTSARGDDTVADFSSRGSEFGASKPDLVAPGVSLVSTRAAGSTADVENPASRVGDSYFTGSGTSMSEAVTAGAAAVVIGTRPALTPDSVKRLLTKTAYDTDTLEKADGAGNGALDLAAAVAAAPTAKIVQAKRAIAKLADDRYGPDPADAAAWQQFSDAWAAGDLEAVAAIWVTLSEQTRRWAATAFSLAMLAHNAGTDREEFAAIEALARRWSTEAWNARRWSTDAWVARRWSSGDWDARRWSFADFAARRWSDIDWSARRWSDAAWDARRWSDADWDARRWSETDWLAFAWVARRWSSVDWASSSWDEQAWSARRWSEQTWSDFAWDARRWSTSTWDARRWSATMWTASV
ncbi:MAG: S8 family serine peptidase [Candidatus Nanopelagicales bacterium]